MVEVVGEGARSSRTYAATDARPRGAARAGCPRAEPEPRQRNETAVRWFLLALLDPEDRRAVIERELAYAEEESARLEVIAARTDGARRTRSAPTVELGLRLTP